MLVFLPKTIDMRLLYVVILVCILSVTAHAQQMLYGKIVNSQTFTSLSGVYVENTTKHTLAESDTSGIFTISVDYGDTLLFSSIGYHWKKYVVVDGNHQTFLLDEQIYDLSKVVKHAPLDYESFKYAILSMKFPKDSLHVNLVYEKYIPIKEYTPGQIGVASIDGAITGLYNSFNKHAKNQLRAVELLEQKHIILIANKKFTKELVLDVTRLPKEYLNEFIAFCAFTDEFIANASEYQIILALQYKTILFLQRYPYIQKM